MLIKQYAFVFGKCSRYHYFIFSKGGFTDGIRQLEARRGYAVDTGGYLFGLRN